MVVHRSVNSVEFRFHRPEARGVFLVGDFNNWHESAQPMSREADGAWVCRMHLPAGTYRFKYLADDQWYADYAAFGIEWGPLGCNSILVVDGCSAREEAEAA